MPFYIRNDEAGRLAEEYRALTGLPSKSDAVIAALRRAIADRRDASPLAERVEAVVEAARRLGPHDPAFDMKRFSDELSGEG